MTVVNTIVSMLILIGASALIWQLGPQGPRGRPTPIVALLLLALSYILVTPLSEQFFDQLLPNLAYLISHLCSLSATVLTTLFARCYLTSLAPLGREVIATCTAYGCVGVLLVYLFLTSPQRPHGAGFGLLFAGNPRMQIYWIAQAFVMIHALTSLARVVTRARAHERRWRKGLLSVLVAVALVFTGYEFWVIVVVTVWPAVPPLWAQCFGYTLQIAANVLLVSGTIGPAMLGAYRSTRVARSYLERLTPLHYWLTQRYPQVRFRSHLGRRAETRVTDMLIEISDALRLLQHDAPALAAAYGLEDATIHAAAQDSPHHAAYELTAAHLFRTRRSPTTPDRAATPDPHPAPTAPRTAPTAPAEQPHGAPVASRW